MPCFLSATVLSAPLPSACCWPAEILRLHGAIPRYNPRIMPLDGGGPGFLRISGESGTCCAPLPTISAAALCACSWRWLSQSKPCVCEVTSTQALPRVPPAAEEYPARQLALTGPLLGLNATAAPSGDSPSEAGLWVRYFGPQPSLVDEDDEGPQVRGAASHPSVSSVCGHTPKTYTAVGRQLRQGTPLCMAAGAQLISVPLHRPHPSHPPPATAQGSQQHLASVTHWVAADVTSRLGLRLVAAALQYRSSSGRVAVLVNSGAAAAGSDSKGQRLAPIERLMVAVSSGLLQTGGRRTSRGLGGRPSECSRATAVGQWSGAEECPGSREGFGPHRHGSTQV